MTPRRLTQDISRARISQTTSDRARDAEFHGFSQETYDEQLQHTIIAAEATYRCYLSTKGPFPTHEQELNWVKSVWPVASTKTGTQFAPPSNLAERLAAVCIRFRADVKAKIAPLVERIFEFETGESPERLGRNTERARYLKTDAAFINGENGVPYQHPIIQQCINVIWFGDRRGEGVMFSEEFYPIPYEAVALVLAVIECCLDEWSKGSRIEIPFAYEHYKETHLYHLSALKALTLQGLNTRHCDPLHQLRRDLYDEGRRHTGVTPRVLTDSRQIWSQERVNAACEGLLPAWFAKLPPPSITDAGN
ncbi:hypothetical protein B0F90DRAFT_1927313 [Multifurca ochricompacta]|uniref:DUF6532 domain-containing protein n=1 Tax=Multifurca ochricompacta TaxID=376703 RepID=A0AAD4LZ38_9AGAM|nr:hypothetical protein B0F90DRAFT_1927313 [Multifurca ochricompacta]